MDWKIKVVAFWIFQFAPGGKKLHELAQRRVTRSLTSQRRDIAERSINHLKHVARFLEAGSLEGKTLFEFGAGHDLLSNLIMYRAGVTRQLVIDIVPSLSVDLVNQTITDLEALDDPSLLRKASARISSVDDLKTTYGIEYRAPADARNTGLPDDSIDLIASTNTLEHIPPAAIKAILKECARILKPSGLASFVIDYGDHYSYTDNAITPYNFLKFSSFAWKFCNPDAHYQNRMRHSQFVDRLSGCPLNLKSQSAELIDNGVEDIMRISVAPEFRHMPPADLAARTGRFLLTAGA